MPAQPAPTMRTSCLASTDGDAIRLGCRGASDARAGGDDVRVRVELLEVLLDAAPAVAGFLVVRLGIPPRGARVEETRGAPRNLRDCLEAEELIFAVLD